MKKTVRILSIIMLGLLVIVGTVACENSELTSSSIAESLESVNSETSNTPDTSNTSNASNISDKTNSSNTTDTQSEEPESTSSSLAESLEIDSSETSDTSSNFYTSDTKPKSKSLVWICPNSINLSTGYVKDDFTGRITNKNYWPELLKHTRVLKLYIQQMYTTSAEQLIRIAAFVRENELLVDVELGGVRMAPDGTPIEQIAKAAYDVESKPLERFIELGGRIDYITTDHALADQITKRTDRYNGATMQQMMKQQALYYRMMQEMIPGLKVGAIESLGYFWVNSTNRQYKATDPTLGRVDFETYLSEFVRITKENGVTLDHFHVDFGLHDIEYDGDYGRVLAVENCCRANGVDVGFIAGNAFHKSMQYPVPDDQIESASKEAAERTLQYFEGYQKAGGTCDYFIFQRWQPYPLEIGSEGKPYTTLGIFKTLLDSPYFPKFLTLNND